jgi:protein-S-isoprenylcysteine O-methyltransferase Ste14
VRAAGHAIAGIAVVLTLLAWAAFEASLLIRDAVRGKGSTANDRGTRSLLVALSFAAFAAATLAAWSFGGKNAWSFGRGPEATGLVLMWLGLGLRIWAIGALGSSFRTTVEVDAGQAVVDSGPYRWIRHPSYAGILLIAAGYGLALGNWVSLAILLVIPAIAMVRRITVEEATLAQVLGDPYTGYQRRTKRLVPGVW